MHPEMIRAIAAQQVTDRLAEARAGARATVARQARKARAGTATMAPTRSPAFASPTT